MPLCRLNASSTTGISIKHFASRWVHNDFQFILSLPQKEWPTRRVCLEPLVLLADVNGRQLGLRHRRGVVHQQHRRVDVNVVVILRRRGRSPDLPGREMSKFNHKTKGDFKEKQFSKLYRLIFFLFFFWNVIKLIQQDFWIKYVLWLNMICTLLTPKAKKN